MLLENRTPFDARLNRGLAGPNLLLGSVVVSATVPLAKRGARNEFTPGKGARALEGCRAGTAAVWRGTSITVGGHVRGSTRSSNERRVAVAAANQRCDVDVLGPRVWRRADTSHLAPSEAQPFDEIELTFEHAFGGGHALLPGCLPGSDIPTSGGSVIYGANPRGRGFYPSEKAALDSPLPSIEWANGRVRSWSDRPIPAGISPCADLGALRVGAPRETASSAPATLLESALRAQHHAPGWLILGDCPVGTRVSVAGVGNADVELDIPELSFVVRGARAGRASVVVPPEIRAVHLDVTAQVATLIVGHNCSWPATRVVTFTVEEV